MASEPDKSTRPAPGLASGDRASGYHGGAVDTVISVDDVNREAKAIAEIVTKDQIMGLVEGEPFLQLEELRAGYGKMEILHGIDLAVGKGQSLCLIGPNGAGKSTILHAIFGFCTVFSGKI
ncbi:MAG: ATP-binding cassette domain-containing protein, partial [Geminicoccaceae bacterium]